MLYNHLAPDTTHHTAQLGRAYMFLLLFGLEHFKTYLTTLQNVPHLKTCQDFEKENLHQASLLVEIPCQLVSTEHQAPGDSCNV